MTCIRSIIAVTKDYKPSYLKSNSMFSLEDVEKAIQMARLITEKGTNASFDVESIAGCTEICTYGWQNKFSDYEIINTLQKQ